MLKRAGYLDRDGQATPLGRRTLARLEQLAESVSPGELFNRLGVPTTAAEDGTTFFFPIETGRLDLLQCPSCNYAAAMEVARFGKHAEASDAARPVEKVLTPECNSIESLAQFLRISKTSTAKALMYTRVSDGKFVFVVVRGDMQMSLAKLTAQTGECRPATTEEIVAAGATPGFASPIGLKEGAVVVVDDLIPDSPNLVAGANEAGYHLLNTNYGRDYTAQIVADVAQAEVGSPCPNCGTGFVMKHGELLAGPQGMQRTAILEAVAETHRDAKGLLMPDAIAPFSVYLMHVPGKEIDTRAKAAETHDQWEAQGIAVLFDDREDRAGVKFADADLIGLPVRATVGERGMKDGMVELKARSQGAQTLVPFPEAVLTILSLKKMES